MPVNLSAPDPAALLPIAGVRLGIAEAGIRKANRKDLLVMALDPGARVAGVFTQNRFCAAPVIVAREHLACGHEIRALLVNTGCANAGTGDGRSLAGARELRGARDALGCESLQVLPFSTGVIMEPLPVGTSRRWHTRCARGSARGQLGRRRRGDHDHRHAAQGGVAPGGRSAAARSA